MRDIAPLLGDELVMARKRERYQLEIVSLTFMHGVDTGTMSFHGGWSPSNCGVSRLKAEGVPANRKHSQNFSQYCVKVFW